MKIENTWAIITGATSGIGKSFAYKLADRKVNLIIVARRENLLLEIQKDLIEKFKIKVEIFVLDLTLENSATKLFEFATNGREVQTLINNAGIGFYKDFLDTSLEDNLKMINLNLNTPTRLMHLFSKHMLGHKKESYITNIASIAAYQPLPEFGVYCGTKSYLKDLSQSLSYELKDTNIHVTCVCPGGTKTEFSKHARQDLKNSESFVMMEASQVVDISLNAMDKKRVNIITGLLNWFSIFSLKFLSEKYALRVSHFAMKSSLKD